MRLLYNIVLGLVAPFLPLRLLWKSIKSKDYRKRIGERFGFLKIPPVKSSIWVHLASVGEATAAIPLIRELITRYPAETIVVTTMTPTGAERLNKVFWGQILQLYAPYDLPCVVKKFLKLLNPKILVILETELWPNILYYAAKQNVPILLANARISARSFTGYKKIPKTFSGVINCITKVAAQSKADGERFLGLGLDPKRLVYAGNIKFDISIPESVVAQGVLLRERFGKDRPIWIAASTHKNEEEKILTAHAKICQQIPNSLLILVPRHPERFAEVFELCVQRNFNVICYSKNTRCLQETNIVLGDVMGQLLQFYAASNVAFVGGSLVPWGGHNLLEPAALSKPIITGPNLTAFLEISATLLAENAMQKIADEHELALKIIELLQNNELCAAYGARALKVVEKNRGATEKVLRLISDLKGK